MKEIIEKLNEYAYKGEIISTVESLKLQFFLGNISLYKINLKTRTFNSLMRKGCRPLGDAFKWNGRYNKIVNFDIVYDEKK